MRRFFVILMCVMLAVCAGAAYAANLGNITLSPVFDPSNPHFTSPSQFGQARTLVTVSVDWNEISGTYTWTYQLHPMSTYTPMGLAPVATNLQTFILGLNQSVDDLVIGGIDGISVTFPGNPDPTVNITETVDGLQFDFDQAFTGTYWRQISFESNYGLDTMALGSAWAWTSDFTPGYNVEFTAANMPIPNTPEPASLIALATGAVAMFGYRRFSK